MTKTYYLVIDDFIIDFECESLRENRSKEEVLYNFNFTSSQKALFVKKLLDIMVLDLSNDRLNNSNLNFISNIIHNAESIRNQYIFFSLAEAKLGLKNLKISEILE
jgi:hypothetical protein